MTLRSMWVLTGSNSRHNCVAYFGRSNREGTIPNQNVSERDLQHDGTEWEEGLDLSIHGDKWSDNRILFQCSQENQRARGSICTVPGRPSILVAATQRMHHG